MPSSKVGLALEKEQSKIDSDNQKINKTQVCPLYEMLWFLSTPFRTENGFMLISDELY